MPQLWQGRSSKAVDSRVNDFNSSIRFDARMIEQDIHGSMVHSAMLGKQGIISQQDVDDIHKGLQSILNDLHSGALEIDPNAEDVHTFVEQTLTARVGDAGNDVLLTPKGQPEEEGSERTEKSTKRLYGASVLLHSDLCRRARSGASVLARHSVLRRCRYDQSTEKQKS